MLQIVRAETFEDALALPSQHQYGNGVAIFTCNGRAAREFAARVNVGMVGINVRSGAGGVPHLRRLEALCLGDTNARHGRREVLHQGENGDCALAGRHDGRQQLRYSDDAVMRALDKKRATELMYVISA